MAIPAQSLPPSDDAEIKLCSAECEKDIEQVSARPSTESGHACGTPGTAYVPLTGRIRSPGYKHNVTDSLGLAGISNDIFACLHSLALQYPLETLPSGLQYRDIVKGKGPSPPVGFQVPNSAS